MELGVSSSFTLPAMHSLGQLRQLLLEVDTSGKQVRAERTCSTLCLARA
jgi:hypothetical protein